MMDSLNRIATASCTAAPCSGDSATYNIDRYGNRWSETGTLPGAAPPAWNFTGNGIHGTLFIDLPDRKRHFPNKREEDVYVP